MEYHNHDNATFSLSDKVIIDGLMSNAGYGVRITISSIGNMDVDGDPLSVTINTISGYMYIYSINVYV